MRRGSRQSSSSAQAAHFYQDFIVVSTDGDDAANEWIGKTLREKQICLAAIKNPMGNNILHHACYAGLLETVKMCLENGINPNDSNNNALTALDIAKDYRGSGKNYQAIFVWLQALSGHITTARPVRQRPPVDYKEQDEVTHEVHRREVLSVSRQGAASNKIGQPGLAKRRRRHSETASDSRSKSVDEELSFQSQSEPGVDPASSGEGPLQCSCRHDAGANPAGDDASILAVFVGEVPVRFRSDITFDALMKMVCERAGHTAGPAGMRLVLKSGVEVVDDVGLRANLLFFCQPVASLRLASASAGGGVDVGIRTL